MRHVIYDITDFIRGTMCTLAEKEEGKGSPKF